MKLIGHTETKSHKKLHNSKKDLNEFINENIQQARLSTILWALKEVEKMIKDSKKNISPKRPL
jgi:hypothetical protein